MPLTGPDKLTDSTGLPMSRFLEIRWSSLSPLKPDWLGSGHPEESVNNHRPRRIDFVLTIQILEADHAIFEAWIELPKGRKTILPRQPLSCETSSDETFLHIDCKHDGKRLLALSMTSDESTTYAQSDLLAEAGFRGGTFDPPRIRRLEADSKIASA